MVRASTTAVEWKLTERLIAETPIPQKNLTMFSGGIEKTWEFGARKAVEYCKPSLTGHSSRSLEDRRAESTEDLRGPTQELSEESKAINSSWLRDHSCKILANAHVVRTCLRLNLKVMT